MVKNVTGEASIFFLAGGGSPGETPASEASQKVSTMKCTIWQKKIIAEKILVKNEGKEIKSS